MLSYRCFASWVVLLTSRCTFQSTWAHPQIVKSAFVKRNGGYKNLWRRRRHCLTEKECTPPLLTAPTASSSEIRSNSRIALNSRGGASSSYGNNYNDRFYGKYQDGRGDDGRRHNDDGFYNRKEGFYDERDQSYSTSHVGGTGGRGRYHDEDDYSRGNGAGSGYYDGEGRYHDYYVDQGRGTSSRLKSKPKLPTALTSSNRKLGTIFLSSGAAFTIFGITLFFNKTLMRLGNLLFVAGVPLTIGLGRTVGYFLQPQKARATGCLGCGIFLVLMGHPVLGILLEIFGLLNLFGNMFPLVMMMAKKLPAVGVVFRGGNDSGGRNGGKRKESSYDNDRHYEEEGYERISAR